MSQYSSFNGTPIADKQIMGVIAKSKPSSEKGNLPACTHVEKHLKGEHIPEYVHEPHV